ncbi:unnamed protein product [Somion occarium]|uniref:Peptidase C14 caspase domain-containing protein n=1 Tax=Somion occarium TaxID=3059160 RepID=A0ABP1DRV2_9APHY
MMWDLSGGAASAPNLNSDGYYQAPVYPGGSSFPMPEAAPSPFMPIGAPMAPVGSPVYSPAPAWAYANQPSVNQASYAQRAPTAADYGQQYQSAHHSHSHQTTHTSHGRHRLHSSSRPHNSEQRPPSAPPVVSQHSHASHAPGGHAESYFQYSKCTGKRKAVCIGVNYTGQQFELRGCVNDAKNVHRFLTRYHHYRDEDIVLLTDDSNNPRAQPTKANIIDAMKWLVRDAQPDDSLFFHYSGHGGQVKDRDGDEVDGYDEVIFPLDYKKAGCIVDDLMNSIMVSVLPVGCRLTALFDSCHSGSVLDLPYLYHTDGRVKGSQVKSSHRKRKGTHADVISWSGCKDSQTSADTFESGAAAGAMSYAFMTVLKHNPHQSYQELLKSVREILRKKYSQKPQLSSSHRIDTNLQFIM